MHGAIVIKTEQEKEGARTEKDDVDNGGEKINCGKMSMLLAIRWEWAFFFLCHTQYVRPRCIYRWTIIGLEKEEKENKTTNMANKLQVRGNRTRSERQLKYLMYHSISIHLMCIIWKKKSSLQILFFPLTLLQSNNSGYCFFPLSKSY